MSQLQILNNITQQQQQQQQQQMMNYQSQLQQYQQCLYLQQQIRKLEQISKWYEGTQQVQQTTTPTTPYTSQLLSQQQIYLNNLKNKNVTLLQRIYQCGQLNQQMAQKVCHKSASHFKPLNNQPVTNVNKKVKPPVPKFLEINQEEDVKEQNVLENNLIQFDEFSYENQEEIKNQQQEQQQEIAKRVSQEMEEEEISSNSTQSCGSQSNSEEKKIQEDITATTTTTERTYTYTQKYCGFQKKKLANLEALIDQLLLKLDSNNSYLRAHCLGLCEKIVQCDHECLKSRNQETLAAAIIIFSSRIISNPITTRKISKYIECKERTLNKIFKFLKELFDKENATKLPDPLVFVKTYVTKLSLPETYLQSAEALARQIQQEGLLDGENPTTTAACLVKIIMNLNGMEISSNKISEISGVCCLSLRNQYNKIYPHIAKLIQKIPNHQNLFTVSSQFLSEQFN